MTIYFVAIFEPTEEPWTRLETKWPHCLSKAAPQMAFVAPHEAMTVQQVAETAGLTLGGPYSGVVINLGEHSIWTGFGPQNIVEWIRNHQS